MLYFAKCTRRYKQAQKWFKCCKYVCKCLRHAATTGMLTSLCNRFAHFILQSTCLRGSRAAFSLFSLCSTPLLFLIGQHFLFIFPFVVTALGNNGFKRFLTLRHANTHHYVHFAWTSCCCCCCCIFLFSAHTRVFGGLTILCCLLNSNGLNLHAVNHLMLERA